VSEDGASPTITSFLVGGAITILKNMSSSMGRIMENKKCLKPPTSFIGNMMITQIFGLLYQQTKPLG